jgi:hypothetical protein
MERTKLTMDGMDLLIKVIEETDAIDGILNRLIMDLKRGFQV